MKHWVLVCPVVLTLAVSFAAADDSAARLAPESSARLTVPSLSPGLPAAGRKVRVTPPEYAGTEVFHTIYLPPHWQEDGPRLPIIFEYTGNFFPASGSTGEPEDGALGYCLSAGKYIWVSLPYISEDGQDNAVTWWGDTAATVAYAKRNVPRILNEFNARRNAVFLCGFSRGAIGVNYLGLHDDEIAGLWTAFVSHDHFDGVRAWGRTSWGTPLNRYREEAAVRLRRVNGRPYLVSQNGAGYGTEPFVAAVLTSTANFRFSEIDAGKIFGAFPNELVKAAHTDRWAMLPSRYRRATWQWMNSVSFPPESDRH